MGHYAKVVDGIVTKVIVAEPEFFDDFVDDSPGTWVQTSYNTRGGVHYDPDTGEASADQSKALRKNFAGQGMTYDAARDAFIADQPYPSWVLNETSCKWEPPVAPPDDSDTKQYLWNESITNWTEVS